MSILSGQIGGLAGELAASKLNEQILGMCKQDKNGNIHTTVAPLMRGLFRFIIIFFFIADGLLLAVSYLIPDSFEESDMPLVWLISGVGLFFIIILIFLLHRKFSDEFTLLPEGLKVKTSSLKAVIPYEEVHTWMMKYPPVEYRFSYIMVLRDKLIKYNFSSMVGGLGFLIVLSKMVGVQEPDVLRMQGKIKGAGTYDKSSEKAAYKHFMQQLKQK